MHFLNFCLFTFLFSKILKISNFSHVWFSVSRSHFVWYIEVISCQMCLYTIFGFKHSTALVTLKGSCSVYFKMIFEYPVTRKNFVADWTIDWHFTMMRFYFVTRIIKDNKILFIVKKFSHVLSSSNR